MYMGIAVYRYICSKPNSVLGPTRVSSTGSAGPVFNMGGRLPSGGLKIREWVLAGSVY
jgi:hypothetical protein